MSLLLPAFLAAGALIGLPILLHLLRRQPKQPVPFPSLRFLGPAALRDTRRQRILRWLTLLARCLVILLVAFAFARPFWPPARKDADRAVIVLVDNSFSMQAAGRNASLATWLSRQLADLHRPDRLGVLLLHPTPTWLVPLGDDLAAGRSALRTLPTGYESSRFQPGLALAAAVLANTPAERRQIILASDEQRLGWTGTDFAQPLPAGVELLAAPPAAPPSRQAALTRLKITRTPDGTLHFDGTVRAFAPAVSKRTVSFFADGKLLGGSVLELAAGSAQPLHAEFKLPPATPVFTACVSLDADDLPADDTAYAVLPAEGERRVLLASAASGSETDYLAGALAAVRGGDLPSFRTAPLPVNAPWPSAAAVVLRGPAPFAEKSAAALDALLQSGGSAWLLCDGSAAQSAWLARHGVSVTPIHAPAAGLTLRDLALEHPLFAPFAGQSLAPLLVPAFTHGWSLAGTAVEPLARWPDRTVAVAEVAVDAGRLLVTGFDDRRETSTFPVQAAFVPFVHQAVVWLAGNDRVSTTTGRVGETLTLPGAGLWSVLSSPVAAAPLAVNGNVTPAAPGLYEFHGAGAPRRLYAINLDPEESDLSPWPAPTDFDRLVSKKKPAPLALAADREAARVRPADESSVWWWLLATAALLLCAELGLANRTTP
jgi:hypothetical protein